VGVPEVSSPKALGEGGDEPVRQNGYQWLGAQGGDIKTVQTLSKHNVLGISPGKGHKQLGLISANSCQLNSPAKKAVKATCPTKSLQRRSRFVLKNCVRASHILTFSHCFEG